MKDLKKILELLRKTGDRFILEDEKGNIFVVLSVNDYENLILKNSELKNFSEEELLNKINKDIAVWKSTQEDEKLLDNWQNLNSADNEKIKKEEDDQYYFEPVEDED
ncbi:MAG: hypothetical protein NT116_01405 [Candidatus Parcubacteria bacterium]|nr:hypothetical protein [Candidatus Parcubacteria bacterium]